MLRLIWLSLVVALPAFVPIRDFGQAKPPRNFTNSIGMKFVWVPPGSFQMGSSREEKPAAFNEPPHRVTLSRGFYMGVHLVTQEQYQTVMGNNPSHFKGEKNLPVDSISWDDCQEFSRKLRAKDRMAYRLPTESEWEYACRAGTTTRYHFGDTITRQQANFDGTKTTPVDTFPANAWGLHDMHGNLYQWCQDYWGEEPHLNNPLNPQGPATGTYLVLRSGPWQTTAEGSRSASRVPGVQNCHVFTVGFRVCFFVE